MAVILFEIFVWILALLRAVVRAMPYVNLSKAPATYIPISVEDIGSTLSSRLGQRLQGVAHEF